MHHLINPSIFRAYDIRGVVDTDLSESVYHRLGQASGTYFRRREGRKIVVGRDARLTSPAYAAALIEGLRSTGCDVIDLGMVPTPVMYFALAYLQADGGAIVSASHNPPNFNGLKLRQSHEVYGGEPLDSLTIQEIGQLANANDFVTGQGTYEQQDISDAYVDDAVKHCRLPQPVKVVLDAGNGAGGPIGKRTLEAIGCEVVPLYIEPDGRFPNHHPDPLKEANLHDLIAMVHSTGAALGIGLDGDADRLGVVDNAGNIVFADRYLIVLAHHVLAHGPASIVFDVKCSSILPEAIRSFGGTPVMSKTGYPSQSAKMREVDAPLAGELSGHVLTNLPYHTHDDGIFAGCYLLSALAQIGQTLEQVLQPYPALPALSEGRIPFDEEKKFRVVDYLREQFSQTHTVIDIDGVRVEFGDGWGLVRASNTEPAITTRFEARTMTRAAEIRDLMMEKVAEFQNG
ncbi:MAG: phosphomannomutase/phosphoglucomutase [Chloroflexota bacterium]